MNSKAFMKTQSYREIQEGWRWMKDADPEAAAAAIQWTKDHPEEWKEIEHMLYYSEASFHKRIASDSLDEAELKQPLSYNPEAFLPEEVRNAIYDDMRWFDRAKYLPEGSEEDPLMYMSKELDEGLHELTELQREILFRTVINGESTESVARDKQCSSRNIRDIRNRALRHLKSKITKRNGSGTPAVLLIVFAALLASYLGIEIIAKRLVPEYLWLKYVGCAITVILLALMLRRSRSIEVESLLRKRWSSLNGMRKKE